MGIGIVQCDHQQTVTFTENAYFMATSEFSVLSGEQPLPVDDNNAIDQFGHCVFV